MAALGWLLNLGFAASTSEAVIYTAKGPQVLYRVAEQGRGEFELEAEMKATAGTLYARVFDMTGNYPVTNSLVWTDSASYVLLRSTKKVSLVDEHKYQLQLGVAGGHAGALKSAALQGV